MPETGYIFKGRVVTLDRVIEDGYVMVANGKIISVNESFPENCDSLEIIDAGDNYIAPGFVDIHCHAGYKWWAYEDPAKMARYHLEHGTTGLLCTLYRDLGFEKMLKSLDNIKAAMSESPNILGAHLEGPYLNPEYGSKTGYGGKIDKAEYMALASSEIVRQWTFSPEVEGSDAFLRDIVKLGIVPAIGHSAASPEQVFNAAENGARIVTHLFDATGCSISPTRYDGTIEVSFDHAALLCNNLFYEIICDKNGVHVRPDLLRLVIKTVGIDKIIGITDACTGEISGEGAPETDVNFVDGELMGSKLTMEKAAANFLALGLSVPEVFRVTSFTPAFAVGFSDRIGSIASGKTADIIIVDKKMNVQSVFKA